jgi:hypothetical protein
VATLHERYNQGDRVQVWEDLMALGPAVRQPEYIEDARAVARETMLRARHNIETLIPRLDKLGYRFLTKERQAVDDFNQFEQAMNVTQAMLAHVEKTNPGLQQILSKNGMFGALQNPLIQNTFYRSRERAADAAKAKPLDPMEDPAVFAPPSKNIQRRLDKVEKSTGGPLPLSLRAWCEVVGSVSLIGSHPVLAHRELESGTPMKMHMGFPMANFGAAGAAAFRDVARSAGAEVLDRRPKGDPAMSADPLVVEPMFEMIAGIQEGPVELPLAPDGLHKSNHSGGDPYGMEIPSSQADALFTDWHRTTFVNYLRIAFRWGGFPGWERYPNRPEKELAHLAEGLLPI